MQFLNKLRETEKLPKKFSEKLDNDISKKIHGKKPLHWVVSYAIPLLSSPHPSSLPPFQKIILLQLNDTRILLFCLLLVSFRHTWASVETESRAKRWGTEACSYSANKSCICSKQMSFYELSDIHVEKQNEKKISQSLQWSIVQQEKEHNLVFTLIQT